MLFITFYSCNAPLSGSTTPTPVTVEIPHNFYGLLDYQHQLNSNGTYGRNRNTKITISVDRYNGNGTVESNYKTYIYTNRGNKFAGNTSNCRFTNIQVPSSGTYAVSLSVDTMECFDNIYGASCNYTQGMALYRGVSTRYNATSSPGTIYITPTETTIY